jgi:CBS domain-containing protein
MTIGALCNREVVYVNRDVTVHAACKLMRHYHVGSLVVVDEVDGKRTPVGILTDRDIVVEINAMDLDAKVITAGDIMSQELVIVPESEGVLETIEVMRLKGVRRMPIVDAENRLVGIVTIDDLLEVLAEELTDIARIVSREQSYERQARK